MDIPQTISANLSLFADGTCLYATEYNRGFVLRKLQRGLDSLAVWYKPWKWKKKDNGKKAREPTSAIKLHHLNIFLESIKEMFHV
jgi:hypothetical protein